MPSADDGDGSRATLARDAGPVRRWLISYFRRRIRDEAEVEDMVQDVFARMAARDDTTPIDSLGGYVMRIAASVITDRARRRSARHASDHVRFQPDVHSEAAPDPERALSAKEDLHAATLALLSLPERTRTIFILRRLEGRTYREIADHLGVSVSAVEKHMVRAVHHLGDRMGARRGS